MGVVLEQKSAEWLRFRSDKIGASDAASLVGLSPWKSSAELFLEKTGRVTKEFKTNPAIERGNRLEPAVRSLVELWFDDEYPADMRTAKDRPWLLASLDGYCERNHSLIEIKVGNRVDFEKNIVPAKYYPQIQQQLEVYESEIAYYCTYYVEKTAPDLSGRLKILEVPRNQDWINKYLEVADRFHLAMRTGNPPEPVDTRDFELSLPIQYSILKP